MSEPRKRRSGRGKSTTRKVKSRRFKVDYLARVEGEGAMDVKIKDNQVKDVQFKIFEPPRFFEAFLRGRRYTEPPDITARICGICPIAYQMSAVHAVENACGVEVDGPIRALRRLVYCGEWIESHMLHAYMLHTPDFLGYESALHLAKDMPEVVERALALKKVGNELVALIGGREIHPINVRVGGFYRVPAKRELKEFRERLEWARDAAIATITLFSTFDFPDFERDYQYVSVCHPEEYPFNEGRLKSNRGLDIDVADFNTSFEELHAKRSTALHVRLRQGGAYHVGPMARYTLNYGLLTPTCKEAAKAAGLGESCYNPFKSVIVRGVETLYAVEEAIRIIDDYQTPDRPYIDVEPRDGVGHGATEAPRGMLYHRYAINAGGEILEAQIVPPTAQNQLTIEKDLYQYVEKYMDLPDREMQWRLEQSIRNYDPCISCATHFLKLKVDRDRRAAPDRVGSRGLQCARAAGDTPEGPSRMPNRIVVIGAGNPQRGDDAVGLWFSRRIRRRSPVHSTVVETDGDPVRLMEAWADADVTFVVDAVHCEAFGDRVLRFEAHDAPIPAEAFRVSTHTFGVADTIELARRLGRLPPRVVVYGIRGDRFDYAEALSPEVDDACDAVVLEVLNEIEEWVKNG